MTTIANLLHARDNNFTLIRLVAASLVVVSHSFVLATGEASAEPLARRLGLSMGTIGVHVFFVVSGFLVTASLLRRGNVVDFLRARVLRIVPALWCSLILTVLACGLFFSDRGPAAFFQDSTTWHFLRRNAVVLLSMVYELPGVFENNPWKLAVNGSLWTLPSEARLYVALALMWLVLKRRVGAACVVLAIASFVLVEGLALRGADTEIAKLVYMFFAGATLQVLKERITMSGTSAAAAAAALALASLDVELFSHLYLLTLPWLVLWIGLVPSGRIRAANRLGDYSYGIYVYSFPIQQMAAALGWADTPLAMTALCAPPILALAALSWHWVEKPALALRSRPALQAA